MCVYLHNICVSIYMKVYMVYKLCTDVFGFKTLQPRNTLQFSFSFRYYKLHLLFYNLKWYGHLEQKDKTASDGEAGN